MSCHFAGKKVFLGNIKERCFCIMYKIHAKNFNNWHFQTHEFQTSHKYLSLSLLKLLQINQSELWFLRLSLILLYCYFECKHVVAVAFWCCKFSKDFNLIYSFWHLVLSFQFASVVLVISYYIQEYGHI